MKMCVTLIAISFLVGGCQLPIESSTSSTRQQQQIVIENISDIDTTMPEENLSGPIAPERREDPDVFEESSNEEVPNDIGAEDPEMDTDDSETITEDNPVTEPNTEPPAETVPYGVISTSVDDGGFLEVEVDLGQMADPTIMSNVCKEISEKLHSDGMEFDQSQFYIQYDGNVVAEAVGDEQNQFDVNLN